MKEYEITLTKKVTAYSQEHAEQLAISLANENDLKVDHVAEDILPF